MILRTLVLRQGRTALATPFSRTLRYISTETQQLETYTPLLPLIEIKTPLPIIETKTIKQLPRPLKLVKAKKNRKAKQPTSEIVKTYQIKTKIQKTTGQLGSIIEPFYEPHSILINPPTPKDVTLELLMASQSHMGHSTSIWNPANQRYIYGIRQGIHIISLEQTAAHLRRAAKVVEGVAYQGGLILFIGTRPGQDRCVIKAASLAKGCHLFQRWIPGTITNGDKILANCASRIVNEHDQVVEGFDAQLREMSVLKPDLVVCLNPLENYIALHECGLHNIPTIGIIDTDANPTWVTYPIPANDDSIRCVQVIAGVLGRAGEQGQRKRLEQAKNGVRTWKPPFGLGNPAEKGEEVQFGESAAVQDESLRDPRTEDDLLSTI